MPWCSNKAFTSAEWRFWNARRSFSLWIVADSATLVRHLVASSGIRVRCVTNVLDHLDGLKDLRVQTDRLSEDNEEHGIEQ